MEAHSFVLTLKKEAKKDDPGFVKAKPEIFTGADCIRLIDAPVPYLALPPKPEPAVLPEIRVQENSPTIKVSWIWLLSSSLLKISQDKKKN